MEEEEEEEEEEESVGPFDGMKEAGKKGNKMRSEVTLPHGRNGGGEAWND